MDIFDHEHRGDELRPHACTSSTNASLVRSADKFRRRHGGLWSFRVGAGQEVEQVGKIFL